MGVCGLGRAPGAKHTGALLHWGGPLRLLRQRPAHPDHGWCCLQVMPIELPGHGSRMKEPRLTDLCPLSTEAVAAIEPHIR